MKLPRAIALINKLNHIHPKHVIRIRLKRKTTLVILAFELAPHLVKPGSKYSFGMRNR
uniref:Uncharacterized protein n=1 Tax=Picea glauca TaxID=3330 RepID=A0A117NH56_PICGL|nr:hypothetical protein ABT39_MTgene4849 [Picea glauca]QHR88659.1 hypothetical protein Q903MT_gene2673 [Picea sitchensis]